jgi:hypothetical protein
LSPNAPWEYCPSISAYSLLAYFDYKVVEEGKEIVISRDIASDAFRVGPVRDVFTKQIILASGSWNDPGCVNQLLSTISTRHMAGFQNAGYTEPCAQCITEFESGQRQGSRFHLPIPRLFLNGSPRDYIHIKNRYHKVSEVDLPDYQPQGDSPLLPHEIIAIRTALLSRNLVSGLRQYVMLLFHTLLFLRSKSGINFQFSDFLYGLVSINRENEEVLSIGVKIKGKSDETFKALMIWRNDSVPELCLVRHLLLWIHISGIRSSYLFGLQDGANPIKYGTWHNS